LKVTFFSGGKNTLRVLLGLALVVRDPRRDSISSVEFFKIGRTPNGKFNSYVAFRRVGVNVFVLCSIPGDAVAEIGDGRSARSKVLLNVFKVVGVFADKASSLLLAVVDLDPYDDGNDVVCNDSFGLLEGGMTGLPKDKAAASTWSRCVQSGGPTAFIGASSIVCLTLQSGLRGLEMQNLAYDA
jgi:hypothetical protein